MGSQPWEPTIPTAMGVGFVWVKNSRPRPYPQTHVGIEIHDHHYKPVLIYCTVPFNSNQQGVWPVTDLTKLRIRQAWLWLVTYKKFNRLSEGEKKLLVIWLLLYVQYLYLKIQSIGMSAISPLPNAMWTPWRMVALSQAVSAQILPSPNLSILKLSV